MVPFSVNLPVRAYGLSDRFRLLGSIPNPLKSPLTTYNTAKDSFDGVLREFLQKSFPYSLLRGSLENAKQRIMQFQKFHCRCNYSEVRI